MQRLNGSYPNLTCIWCLFDDAYAFAFGIRRLFAMNLFDDAFEIEDFIA